MNPNPSAPNPVADTAYADAWRDPEGQAAFERIVATERAATPTRRHGVRRLLPAGLAVALTAGAIGAAVAVVGTSGDRDTVTHATRPAAWVVTKSADGTVTVAFQDYRDPKGLETRLQAAGVRANVVTLDASCYPSSTGGGRFGILVSDPSMSQSDTMKLFPFSREQELSIDPSYLPSDATVWIGFPPPSAAAADRFFSLAVQPTDGPSPCPLEIAKSHQTGQMLYLVRPAD